MARFSSKFKSDCQEWETPDSLYDSLDGEFHFGLDVCASGNNAKCDCYYTVKDDGLSKRWSGVCWMNPPFNKVGVWVRKAFLESLRGCTVVCLVPARTNTGWWHDYCLRGEIRFIRGRPKFKGAKHGLPQPLAVVIFRPIKGELLNYVS